MSAARNGKIARLPRVIRDQLNARLDDGEESPTLLLWLNSLSEVRALIAGEFRGMPILKQNLSQWRRGGFRDWQACQEARRLAEQFHDQAAAAQKEGAPPLSEELAQWVAAHYAVSSRRVADAEGSEQWRLLREMSHDVARLRRSDHNAQRMNLQRERMAIGLQIAEIKARQSQSVTPGHTQSQ